MIEEKVLDYFYETQVKQLTFYQVPKILFTDDRFKFLSSNAKILFSLMLECMYLCIKNSWLDEKKYVYIIFILEQVIYVLNYRKDKEMKILNKLE